MLAPPAGFLWPAPLDPLRVVPPAILYDAHVYVNTRSVHDMEMIYDEHECSHMDELITSITQSTCKSPL
jgi:hypothetical protein